MSSPLTVQLKPQYLAYSDFNYQGFRLHTFQKLLYGFDNLGQVSIFVAPTGAGKSFAFPLPVFNARDQKLFARRRGMVVVPTNALIDDMYRNFTEYFPEIHVEILNGHKLDSLGVHGPERWKMVLKIIDEADLILTNPDLLNFIMYSGYAGQQIYGLRTWSEVLEKTHYFVFDEYHLYDEEQIADILCLILIDQKIFGGDTAKFIFCSATPEKGLEDYLASEGIEFSYYEERLTETGRLIHAPIDLTFQGGQIVDFLESKIEELKSLVKDNHRILIIYDRLRELHFDRQRIKQIFSDFKVEEESGWTTRSIHQDHQRLQNAQIILGTNKVEVGVNLDADVCIMQEGPTSRNFLQRLGRVARGDRKGQITIFTDTFEALRNVIDNKSPTDYYSFVERYTSIKCERQFYTDKLPQFVGAFLYAIKRHTANNILRKVLSEQLNLSGISKQFWSRMGAIDAQISSLYQANAEANFLFPPPKIRAWQGWWKTFLETFKYFRENKVIVRVLDLEGDNYETMYSLEWILRNKEVEAIEEREGKKIYVVSGTKPQSEDILYVVNSLAPCLDESGHYLRRKDYFKLKESFLKAWAEAYRPFQGHQDQVSMLCGEIFNLIKQLVPLVTYKRLNITDIVKHISII